MKRAGFVLFSLMIILWTTAPAAAVILPESVERGLPIDWRGEHPEVPQSFVNMGPRSLAIDSSNHLHYAYGNDHLYYSHNDGAGWAAPVMVDSDWGVGAGASLAVDSAGKVHISYVDTSLGAVRYATNKSGNWVVSKPPTNGAPEAHTALVLDLAGYPIIFYHNTTNDTIESLVGQMGGSWFSYTLNTPGDGGGEVAAARGPDGSLHISYYHTTATQSCVGYQYKDAYGWHGLSTPDCNSLSVENGAHSAIAVGSDNLARIAFTSGSSLYYIWSFLGGGTLHWDGAPALISPGINGVSMFLVDNNPFVLYNATSGLHMSLYVSNDWYAFPDPEASGTITDPSVVVDSSGNAHIAYYRTELNRLRSRAQDAMDTWLPVEEIDTSGSELGRCTSLAYSLNGTAHLTYYEAGSNHIKYATKAPGGFWNTTYPYVDDVNTVACEHSLALRGNVPAVAYVTEDHHLRYAEYLCVMGLGCSWLSWEVTFSPYIAPESITLAFTSTGKPRIAELYGNISIMRNDGTDWSTGWTSFTRTCYSCKSGQTAMVIDDFDRVHVAYFSDHYQYLELYYISQVGDDPSQMTDDFLVDSGVGDYVSLQRGSQGLVNIAYTGVGGAGLRFRQQNRINNPPNPPMVLWGGVQTVTSSTVVSPRLTLGANYQPHIFYYHSNTGHLYEASKGSSNWSSSLLDRNALTGQGLSLARVPFVGTLSLAYFDENVWGVKYIYETNTIALPLIIR